MSKIINKSVLVLAGTAVIGIAYTPIVHRKASAEVTSSYLEGRRSYNPMKYTNNWNRSQDRKHEILAQIADIRSQIRKMAATKLIETIACTMENKTRNRDHQLRYERAQELQIPARLISADIQRQRKGMPVIDMDECI